MTGPNPSLMAALDKHHIPQSFATLSGLVASPIPHIPLPPPCEDFCLTNYLESDPPKFVEMLNHPAVSVGLAITKGTAFTLEMATERVKGTLAKPEGWCFPVVRLTKDVLKNDDPALVGNFACRRSNFRMMGPAAADWLKRQESWSDHEAYWSIACAMSPDHGCRGVMTAVTKFVIEEWLLPTYKLPPGHILSSWFLNNVASRKFHAKAGFHALASSPDLYTSDRTVSAVYDPERRLKKEDTILDEIPELDDVDWRQITER